MILNRFIGGPIFEPRLKKVYLINNFEYTICNFMCKYCYLGRIFKDSCPTYFDRLSRLERQIEEYIGKYGLRSIKALLISPIGEPTLDPELPTILKYLKSFGIPVAVYTNGSTLADEHVFNVLKHFDIVTIKFDTLRRDVVEDLNKPNIKVDPTEVYYQLTKFRREFKGKLYLDIMLVEGYNDHIEDLNDMISAIKAINPNKVFINTPYYPNRGGARPPKTEKLTYIYTRLTKFMPNRVEILDYIPEPYANKKMDDPIEEFIYISTLYPMTKEDAYKYFKLFNLNPEETLQDLIKLGDVEIVTWLDREYVMSNTLARKLM